MKKNQFYILLAVLLFSVVIFSNPSEENHIESVKTKLKKAFKKKMNSELTENQDDAFATLGNGLGLLLGDTFIDKLTDGFVSRKNYILFSLTNVEYNGEDKIIGLGILGNVFLSDEIETIFQKDEEKKVQNEENISQERNTELDYIKSYNGKYASDVKFLESENLKSRLVTLLGEDYYKKLLYNTEVGGGINISNNVAFFSGGMAHSFGWDEGAISINLETSKITVGLLDNQQLLIFSEASENPVDFEKDFHDWYVDHTQMK